MSPSPLAQPLALIWFLAGAVVFFDGVRWFESTGLLSGQPFSGWDGRAKARLSAASVVALSLLWLSPALFALVAAVGLVVRWRRGARRNGATQGVRLALVADLFVVGLSAGLSVRQCARSIATLVDGQAGDLLSAAVQSLDRGDSFLEAFFALSESLDDQSAGFFGVLAVADRSGSGAAAVLERFAEHEREVERRRSQEALRTIPVRLLPPLICCILPAFCLTTVVPVVAAVIGSLGIGHVLGG